MSSYYVMSNFSYIMMIIVDIIFGFSFSFIIYFQSADYVFKIFYGEKDKKGEEYSAKDEDLVSEPLKNFVRTKEKTLEDFAFYYKGRPVKFENLLHIKDSIFSQN